MVRRRRGSHGADLEETFLQLSRQTPDKRPTLLEVVGAHQEWIGKLVGQGHSYNRVAEAMTNKGYKISANTLRQYYAKLQRAGTQESLTKSRQRPGPLRKLIYLDTSPMADTNLAEPQQTNGQKGRFKPILPGETEL